MNSDTFIIDQIILENTQIILDNSDEIDISKESYKDDTFIVDQVILENTQIILNDSDKIEDINYDELELENLNIYSKFFLTMPDEIDIEIEDTSMKSPTLYIVVDIINSQECKK
ncbi:3939_t:CDS:2 [Scutellospora calospora]|uniref:3939_t:CDS:1 n=1 Tax=Scutellospora calospora TaxID=85575 RepID=A0ACA9K2M2_9GLOM|nr:3939_t:CDS:2 [Scutellospora calospora]